MRQLFQASSLALLSALVAVAPTARANAAPEESGCVDCQSSGCDVTQHTAYIVGLASYGGGAHTGCRVGWSCEGSHPGCAALANPEEFDSLRTALAAVESGASADTLGLAMAFPTKVHLNRSRHALQVEGCSPAFLLAHIPLSEPQVAALTVIEAGQLAVR